MHGLKLSRAQYAHLIRDIEKSLKKSVTGGSFEPPDTIPYVHDITFWVDDNRFSGGGFLSSLGKTINSV